MSGIITDVIVVAIILFIAYRGVVSMKSHMKGESACCGGGSGELKPDKKKLDAPAVATKVISIKGMSCEHCENTVIRALDSLDGVAVKSCSHKKGQAVVAMSREVSDEELKKAVEEQDYEVTGIQKK